MENETNKNYGGNASEYYDAAQKDLQDLEILQAQAGGQIGLILGYIFDYIATNQAMEVLQARMELRDRDFFSGNYINENVEKSKYGIEEEQFRNRGIYADKTALMAAYLELFGQTIVTYIDGIKLQRLNEHTEDNDYLIAKTANNEIYAGAVFGEISFLYNLVGVQLLYDISNENPLEDQ